MKTPFLRWSSLAAVLVAGLVSSTALAKDGDIEACAGLEEGDACTRADGDPGVCQPDDSDPGVIKCDDDAYGGDDDGSVQCALGTAPAPADTALALVFLGAALALRRR